MEKSNIFTSHIIQKNHDTITKMVLMHKNIRVLSFFLDENFKVTKDIVVSDFNHLPFIMQEYENHGIITSNSLQEWIASRISITNVNFAINKNELITKWYFCGLSDCYWVKPEIQDVLWQDINLFDNDFQTLSLKNNDSQSTQPLPNKSPDYATNGQLPKMWTIKDKTRLLKKYGSGVEPQEPLNEIIANIVHQYFHVDYTRYYIEYINNIPVSCCNCFCNSNIELVTCWDFLGSVKNTNSLSMYEAYIKSLENLTPKPYKLRESLEKMILSDFVIGNTDRHLNNLGYLRNSTTLDFYGLVPIFDSGSSLCNGVPIPLMNPLEFKEINSFETNELSQLYLVKNNNLPVSINTMMEEISNEINKYKLLSLSRKETLNSFITARVDYLLSKKLIRPNDL